MPEVASPLASIPRREGLVKVLALTSPDAAALVPSHLRALDLLELDWPDEGLDQILVWFDAQGKCGDLIAAYRPGTARLYPTPADLASAMEETGASGRDLPPEAGMQRKSYESGGISCEAAVIARGAGLGAFLRYRPKGAKEQPPTIARAMGSFNLDRSFEQNRLLLAPKQQGTVLTLDKSALLEQLASPLTDLKPVSAQITRAPDQIGTLECTLNYATDASGVPPISKVVLPLWQKLGPAKLTGTDAGLALIWADSKSENRLLLPYEDGQPMRWELRALGTASGNTLAVKDQDTQERRARIEAGKAMTRLPRDLGPWRLGQSREQLIGALPSGKSVLRKEGEGSLLVTFSGEVNPKELATLRQLIARWDSSGKVVELRGRYVPGPAAKGKDFTADVLNRLHKLGGVPIVEASPWTKLWADLPARKNPPTRQVWHDDLTRVAVDRDGGVLDVIATDCPLDQPAGVTLGPWAVLPRGIDGIALGISRDALKTLTKDQKEETAADGSVVVTPPANSPFEVLLLYFQEGKLARILGRYRAENPPATNVTAAVERLQQLSGAKLPDWGWPRRQDSLPTGAPVSTSWADDATRLRLFWQENDAGVYQFYLECRAIPK